MTQFLAVSLAESTLDSRSSADDFPEKSPAYQE